MPGNRATFEAAMKRAAEHAWNQRWDLALVDYERAAEEFPEDMAARGNLALAYYRLGDWDRALTHYSWMLEHAPENAFIMDRLIEVYLKVGRYADAKAVQARLNMLNQKLRTTTGGATMPTTGEATAVLPSLAEPTFDVEEIIALAMAYEESGQVADAIAHYEQAIAAGLDRADAFYSLGLLYQQQGRHDKALSYFSHALDDAEYAMSATFASGISKRALGQKEDGARMLSLAISLIDHNQIGPAEVDELVNIYRTTIEALDEIGNYLQASNLASSLADFLAGREGYHAAVAEFRAMSQQLQEKLNARANRAGTVEAAPTPPPPTPLRPAAPAAPPVQPETVAPAPAPPRARGRTTDSLGSRSGIVPPADVEMPERLSSSYRRMTGPLSGETRRITSPLVSEPQRSGGAPAATEPALPAAAERPVVDRRLTAVSPVRRRQIRAISGPLLGIERQPEAIRALAAEADADAHAGHLLGAMDACYAMIGLAPDYLPAQLRLAELHACRGDLSTALDIIHTALKVLNARQAPTSERLPFLRLTVRLRPTDDAALSAYTAAAREANQAVAAAPLMRRLVARLMRRGATNRALTEAERLAQALPDDTAASLHFADALLMLGQPERALDLYRQVLPTAPENLQAIAGANAAFALLDQDTLWWSSLETLMSAGEAAEPGSTLPIRLYRRLAATPTATRIHTAAGLLLLAVNRPELVRTWLAPVLADAQADGRIRAVAHHAAAVAAAALDEPAAEREHRQSTLSLLANPKIGQFLADRSLFGGKLSPTILGLELADLLVNQNDLAGAIRALEWLRGLVPGDEAILSRLSELQLKAGHLGDALAALDELATHHRDAGRLEQMAAVLDRMSQMAPNNIGVKTKLIDAYLQRGFVEQARRELELRAQLQITSGKLADAIASLQRAADICWTLGRPQEAFVLAERMVSVQSSNSDARQYLITLYLQAGMLGPAVEHTWALANMHLAAGNQRDAIAALHQIIGLSPDDSKAHHRLGETLASIGEYAQAERVYRRLVRDHPDDQVARARQVAMAALVGETDAA